MNNRRKFELIQGGKSEESTEEKPGPIIQYEQSVRDYASSIFNTISLIFENTIAEQKQDKDQRHIFCEEFEVVYYRQNHSMTKETQSYVVEVRSQQNLQHIADGEKFWVEEWDVSPDTVEVGNSDKPFSRKQRLLAIIELHKLAVLSQHNSLK